VWPYPSSSAEATSAPAAISSSTTCSWPVRAASMSAVSLPHYGSDATAHSAWLGLDGSRWSHSAHGIPVFVLRVKVGAGGDEKLDHTRVE